MENQHHQALGRQETKPARCMEDASGKASFKKVKLSQVQTELMRWLGQGWSSCPGSGMSICVNGKRVCNVHTLLKLEREGFVEQARNPVTGFKLVGQWRATELGKSYTRMYLLDQCSSE